MSIVLQGSTSGSITLQEPAVAGSTVLDLPATSGTVLVGGTQNIPKTALPTGSVLQVVQAYKSDTFSTTSQAFVDVTGLSASITPISSSSKILVVSTCAMGSLNDFAYMRLVRGSTPIFIGDAAGSRPQASSALVYTGTDGQYNVDTLTVNYLDSPATTSSTTYKIQIRSGSGPNALLVNCTYSDRNTADYDPRVASSLILMEIAA